MVFSCYHVSHSRKRAKHITRCVSAGKLTGNPLTPFDDRPQRARAAEIEDKRLSDEERVAVR